MQNTSLPLHSLIARSRRTHLLTDWIAGVRHHGIQYACLQEDYLWVALAAPVVTAQFRMVATMPGVELFETIDRNQLAIYGKTLPAMVMPDLDWKPLCDWTSLWLPLPANRSSAREVSTPAKESSENTVAIRANQRIKFVLERANHFQEMRVSSGLLCRFEDLESLVLTKPKHLWLHLRFAIQSGGCISDQSLNTLVVGEPTPSIPGIRLENVGNVLTPIPYQWEPRVPPTLVRSVFGLEPTDWMLWLPNELPQIIRDSFLIAVSRPSIRASSRMLQGGNESGAPRIVPT